MNIQNSLLSAFSAKALMLQFFIAWMPAMAFADEEPTNIVFADDAVKALCVANWDTDGDGELSYEEAAAVNDLGKVFYNKEEITSFDELRHFTGLTSLSYEAFSYCTKLGSIMIPSNVVSLGNRSLYRCKELTSIVIPNSVTSIGSRALSQSGIISLSIPKSVVTIGEFAFEDCRSLTSIIVDEENPNYDSRDNSNSLIETASNTLIVGCINSIIPNSVTRIGDSAFLSCFSLSSITLPDGLISIGNKAFSGCQHLQTVTFPNSLTSIGNSAFQTCHSLTSITIPSSVTDIGSGVFSNCSSITSIVVNSDNAVYDSRDNCNAIIRTDDNVMIAGCNYTVIPNTVTAIGDNVFSGCHRLTSINLPDGITSIGDGAFSVCSSLVSVISYIQEPFEISDNVFNDTSATLYVPLGTKEKYEETYAWNLFHNIVEMDIEAVEDGQTVDFAEDIDEDTNLDGNVVGDIFYNISDEDGSYDAEEGCIVVTTPTDDDTMSQLEGQDIFGEDFKGGFTGIVFKVAPGNGSVKIEAQTTGSMVLKVKIGNADPITMELEGKQKVTFPYNVAEETYVYIYGGNNATQAKGMRKAYSDGELRIYGIEVISNAAPTDIDGIHQEAAAEHRYYNLNGQQVSKPQKGLYISDGKKVVVK